jgi:antitoxin PrlF
MRVTSDGQVTIPAAIRQKYGIYPDAEIEFVETEAGPVIRVCPESGAERARRILARLRGSATSGLTTDEIMRLTRGWGEPDPGFDEPGDSSIAAGRDEPRRE